MHVMSEATKKEEAENMRDALDANHDGQVQLCTLHADESDTWVRWCVDCFDNMPP